MRLAVKIQRFIDAGSRIEILANGLTKARTGDLLPAQQGNRTASRLSASVTDGMSRHQVDYLLVSLHNGFGIMSP